jgi:nickel-dependent lactate racemase
MTITEDRTIIGRGGVDTLLERSEKESLIDAALEAWGGEPRRVLLVGPDMTRFHSGAGELAEIFYQRLTPRAQVDLIPALGSHVPMTPQELETMYPGIPASAVKIHNWRTTVRKLGEVPAEYIEDLSEGKLHYSIDVEVNTQLLDGEYDLILSLGQVVPHEVVGMANHVKNIMVGLGGKDILDKTHFLGAVHGMERMMGRIDTPVRRALDYAAASTLSHMPIKYALTVVAPDAQGDPVTRGLFIGDGRAPYLQAARLSQQLNIRPSSKASGWATKPSTACGWRWPTRGN